MTTLPAADARSDQNGQFVLADVDPQTGRLLTIAELQQALRTIRQPTTTPRAFLTADSHALDQTDRVTRQPGFGADGSTASSRGTTGTDETVNEDPYHWDGQTESESIVGEAQLLEEEASPPPDKSARSAADRARQRSFRRARGAGRGRGLMRVARRLLGFDRPTPKRRRDDSWLPHSSPSTDAIGPARSGPTEPGPDQNTGSSSDHNESKPAPDVEVSSGPRGLAAQFWRWMARALLVLLVVTGANQLFVRPFRDPVAPAAVAGPGIDSAAATQVAARYAADYLTYSSDAPTGADTLAADAVPNTKQPPQIFTGSGSVRAELVQPGHVTIAREDQVVVAVIARIRVDPPAAPDPATASTADAGTASNVDQQPDLPTATHQWISLQVPVEATPHGLEVPAAGGVFSAEPPAFIAVPASAGPQDPDTVVATTELANGFFAGYAASAVSYLVSPGASMDGLSGAVTFVSLADWAVTTTDSTGQPSSADRAVGSGAVTWQLTGTELRVTQRYNVSMTRSQGRWYVSGLGPAATSDL